MENVIPSAGYPHWRSPAQPGSKNSNGISHGRTAIAGRIAVPVRLIRLWRQRARDRALLARFDGRTLRDIGLSPADVMREINRPFWRE